MSNHIHQQTIPRGALLGAGLLIVSTIALSSFARQSNAPSPAPAEAASESGVDPDKRIDPATRIEVRFADRPDGALLMLDAATGRELSVMARGSNNFVRGVLRGMFRVRKLESKGHDAPFVLGRDGSRHLVLFDPETARRVDLDSFGPTNSAAFADLLAAGETKPEAP
ncbi:MAG: photosynthetic complex assembly protein PuhC [Labilithrix sp.]